MVDRRIKHESKQWPEEWFLYEAGREVLMTVPLRTTGKTIFLSAKFGPDYPFKPPKVTLGIPSDDEPKFDLLSLYRPFMNKGLNGELQCLIGSECLCCSSLLCGDNWGPTHRLLDVIDQMQTYLVGKQRALERHYMRKIIHQHVMPQAGGHAELASGICDYL